MTAPEPQPLDDAVLRDVHYPHTVMAEDADGIYAAGEVHCAFCLEPYPCSLIQILDECDRLAAALVETTEKLVTLSGYYESALQRLEECENHAARQASAASDPSASSGQAVATAHEGKAPRTMIGPLGIRIETDETIPPNEFHAVYPDGSRVVFNLDDE